MNTITINNIGPISHVTLDLNKVNVIMGPQSSGKSTIAKIVSYCHWVEKRFILDGEYEYDFAEQFIDFHRVSKVYFSKDSLIEYRSNVIQITYKGASNKQEIKRLNGELNIGFLNSKNIYIPAERNFVSTIPDLGKYKRINDNIMNFLYDWYEVKKKYTKENKYPILNLGISYYHVQEKDTDTLVLSENKKELLLNNASSGLQSVLPMLLLLDYLTNGLYDEKITESVNEKEEVEKIIKFFVKDFIKKADNDERKNELIKRVEENQLPFNNIQMEELAKNVESRIEQMKYHFSSIIIEEPEQNLFPTTQRDLVYYMLKLVNDKNRDHKLLITTHSPFVLYALNNCMMGYWIKDKMPIEEQKELKSRESWIDPKLVSVWEIEEGKGTLRLIQDEKTGTINKNYFNSIMNEVMNEYYEMLNHIEI
jgi:predicted ATPase